MPAVVTNDVSQALVPGRPDEEAMAVQHLPGPPPPVEYTVTVFTSAKVGAWFFKGRLQPGLRPRLGMQGAVDVA